MDNCHILISLLQMPTINVKGTQICDTSNLLCYHESKATYRKRVEIMRPLHEQYLSWKNMILRSNFSKWMCVGWMWPRAGSTPPWAKHRQCHLGKNSIQSKACISPFSLLPCKTFKHTEDKNDTNYYWYVHIKVIVSRIDKVEQKHHCQT